MGARILAAMIGLALAQPALAQFSDSYKFLEAVRKKEAETVIAFVEAPGTTPINTRDRTTGETALLITIGRKDSQWTAYLLRHGARSDIAASDGRFPLMRAVELRFLDGIDLLLASKANVNQTNSKGETALMRAVQLKDIGMVRTLIANGADPNKRDSLTGMSAKDYAERDARIPGMLEALAAAKPVVAKPVQGPAF
jgi:ankyrin repeat protein